MTIVASVSLGGGCGDCSNPSAASPIPSSTVRGASMR